MYSTSASRHKAGTGGIGLLKAYDQNFYPSSLTSLSEETAREYAEFFNRNGVFHHEFDGAEGHADVPWGFNKWALFVYQNTDHPVTSNTSGGTPNPWDLLYRMKSNGKALIDRIGGGSAALMLHEERRLATSPIENHFTLARGAALNSLRFVFYKPEPMFGVTAEAINTHGMASQLAEQFTVWRELAGLLDDEQRRLILETYTHQSDLKSLNTPTGHPMGAVVYEARRTGEGYEIQPFTVMRRGSLDAQWKTVQEFGVVMPRQYTLPGGVLELENPFARQSPEFIIHVMNGFEEGLADSRGSSDAEEENKDLDAYMAGVGVDHALQETDAVDAKTDSGENSLMPNGADINPARGFELVDNGDALLLSAENARAEDFFRHEGFPGYKILSDSTNARGLGLTVEGDGSGALLVIQVLQNAGAKDYIVPIDFEGERDILIPNGEACWADGRWGLRYATKRAGPGKVRGVSIGFARIPANSRASVAIKNLRVLREVPAVLKNPTIRAGEGTLEIQGEIPSNRYIWYRGGETVEVYDLNWKLEGSLPAKALDFFVDEGVSQVSILNGEVALQPWLDVQMITKGVAIPIPAPNSEAEAPPEAPEPTPDSSAVPAEQPKDVELGEPVPGSITLIKATRIPLRVGGKIVGTTKLAAGKSLDLIKIDGSEVLVRFGNSELRIPISNTNLSTSPK
jgi:hypothetical protein